MTAAASPKRGLAQSHEPEWDAARRHPSSKANRLQREPARDWCQKLATIKAVIPALDTERHQGFSGAAKPPGRKQNTADRLILMGDWRDSFAANIEKTGAVQRLQRNKE